jgi:hypothetical protein
MSEIVIESPDFQAGHDEKRYLGNIQLCQWFIELLITPGYLPSLPRVDEECRAGRLVDAELDAPRQLATRDRSLIEP